jgi:hypothetical protein
MDQAIKVRGDPDDSRVVRLQPAHHEPRCPPRFRRHWNVGSGQQ